MIVCQFSRQCAMLILGPSPGDRPSIHTSTQAYAHASTSICKCLHAQDSCAWREAYADTLSIQMFVHISIDMSMHTDVLPVRGERHMPMHMSAHMSMHISIDMSMHTDTLPVRGWTTVPPYKHSARFHRMFHRAIHRMFHRMFCARPYV